VPEPQRRHGNHQDAEQGEAAQGIEREMPFGLWNGTDAICDLRFVICDSRPHFVIATPTIYRKSQITNRK
jgi:hypothetical protein